MSDKSVRCNWYQSGESRVVLKLLEILEVTDSWMGLTATSQPPAGAEHSHSFQVPVCKRSCRDAISYLSSHVAGRLLIGLTAFCFHSLIPFSYKGQIRHFYALHFVLFSSSQSTVLCWNKHSHYNPRRGMDLCPVPWGGETETFSMLGDEKKKKKHLCQPLPQLFLFTVRETILKNNFSHYSRKLEICCPKVLTVS